MSFNTWIDTFIDEKKIDLDESFSVEGPNGTNFMTYGHVVSVMKTSSAKEKEQIKGILMKIDFRYGNAKHFIRHLAKAIAI